MRYEVRNSGGPTCPNCGAHELIATAATGELLVASVPEAVEELLGGTRWWQFRLRRRLARLTGFHADLVERLRKQTFLV